LLVEEEKNVTKPDDVQASSKDTVDANFDSCCALDQSKDKKDEPSTEHPTSASVVDEQEFAGSVAAVVEPVTLQSEAVAAAAPKFVPQNLSADEDSWDAMFDDSGECLDPTLLTEVCD